MKKNSSMRLALILLVLTLITSCFVGGTFAKYTSSANASATSATVAKWSFKVGGADIATTTDSVSFNLFSTLLDTDGSAETDVKNSKLAPGTSGRFEIEVKNSSEVNATYSLALSLTNANSIPLEFSTDGGSTWKTTISEVNVTDKAIAFDATDSVTVQWRWAFERGADDSAKAANNTADTALGVAGTASVTVTATVTATQVD